MRFSTCRYERGIKMKFRVETDAILMQDGLINIKSQKIYHEDVLIRSLSGGIKYCYPLFSTEELVNFRQLGQAYFEENLNKLISDSLMHKIQLASDPKRLIEELK